MEDVLGVGKKRGRDLGVDKDRKKMKCSGSFSSQEETWIELSTLLRKWVVDVREDSLMDKLPYLFQMNIIRGRGLFVQSIVEAVVERPSSSAVLAATVAVVHLKIPSIGLLALHRTIDLFKDALHQSQYRRLHAFAFFLADLINQRVVDGLIGWEVVVALLEANKEESTRISIDFLCKAGLQLESQYPSLLQIALDAYRTALQEGKLGKSVLSSIQKLFRQRKSGFSPIPSSLDLILPSGQRPVHMHLDDDLYPAYHLNHFQEDPNYRENEANYARLRVQLFQGPDGSEEAESPPQPLSIVEHQVDQLEEGLQKEVYMLLMSSVRFDECANKILSTRTLSGHENTVVEVMLRCCIEGTSYNRFYALLAHRLSQLKPPYHAALTTSFPTQYQSISTLNTSQMRCLASFYAHLLCADAMDWGALSCISLSYTDTTAELRIFLRYLLETLSFTLGMDKLKARFSNPAQKHLFTGLFPTAKSAMQFSINFFTAIGLGPLTDEMRAHHTRLTAAPSLTG